MKKKDGGFTSKRLIMSILGLLLIAIVIVVVYQQFNSKAEVEITEKGDEQSDTSNDFTYWVSKKNGAKYVTVNTDGEISDETTKNTDADIFIIYNNDYYNKIDVHSQIKYEEYKNSEEDFDSSYTKKIGYFSIADINDSLKEAGSKIKIKDYSDLTFYEDESRGYIKDGNTMYAVAVSYRVPASEVDEHPLIKIETYKNADSYLKHSKEKISVKSLKGIWKDSNNGNIAIQDGVAYQVSDSDISRAEITTIKSNSFNQVSTLSSETYWENLEAFAKKGYLLDSKAPGMVFFLANIGECIFLDKDTIVAIKNSGDKTILKKVSSKVDDERITIDGGISLFTAKKLFEYMDEETSYYATNITRGNEADYDVNVVEARPFLDTEEGQQDFYRIDDDGEGSFEITDSY